MIMVLLPTAYAGFKEELEMCKILLKELETCKILLKCVCI